MISLSTGTWSQLDPESCLPLLADTALFLPGSLGPSRNGCPKVEASCAVNHRALQFQGLPWVGSKVIEFGTSRIWRKHMQVRLSIPKSSYVSSGSLVSSGSQAAFWTGGILHRNDLLLTYFLTT
jgi:hypothetical protein